VLCDRNATHAIHADHTATPNPGNAIDALLQSKPSRSPPRNPHTTSQTTPTTHSTAQTHPTRPPRRPMPAILPTPDPARRASTDHDPTRLDTHPDRPVASGVACHLASPVAL